MIRIVAPSRLHFGLLSFPGTGSWADATGAERIPARRFGGVGLLVAAPGIRLTLQAASAWAAEGPLAERALDVARHFVASLPDGLLPPQRLVIEQAAPEHAGLGTGTQLGLAVARGLAAAAGWHDPDPAELARRIGRGERSAIGVHGFARGGFLVDGGKRDTTRVAPLLVRADFPAAWRVVLAIPGRDPGLHGGAEREAFGELRQRALPVATTDALCRLVLLGMLPALVEHDLHAFGEAVGDYNARVGEVFAPWQGGTYRSGLAADLIAFLRREGLTGVGQSSWGPTVFAVVADEERGQTVAQRLRERFTSADITVLCTAACHRGATVELG